MLAARGHVAHGGRGAVAGRPRAAGADEAEDPLPALGADEEGDGLPEVEDVPQEASGNATTDNWFIHTAKTVMTLGQQLQRELLSGKIVKLFAEFCNTPKPQNKGVAYADTVYLYDTAQAITDFPKARSSAPNIYVGIRHRLLDGVDPVLQATVQRLWKMYRQTFVMASFSAANV